MGDLSSKWSNITLYNTIKTSQLLHF